MLSQEIIKTLKEFKSVEQLTNHKVTTPLEVAIVNRNPSPYISDGLVSCQVILPKSKNKDEKYELRPFNIAKTLYYAIQLKLWKWFDFQDNQGIQQVQFAHAYQPQFFYKTQEIQHYIKKRQNINYDQNNQIIRIKKWQIKIVNISCSGYYAPVIDIDEYQTIKNYNIDFKKVTSILFNSQIQKIMEYFRVQDIKIYFRQKQKKKIINQNQKISLCYYTKNAKVLTVPSSISSFAKADMQGKYLKYDKQNPNISYVPLGSVSGICRFMKPIANKSQKNKLFMNFNQFPQIHERKLENSESESESLWSDSDDQINQRQEQQEEIKSVQMEQIQQQQSSQDQQPLKLLYMKQMKEKSIL